MPKFLKAVLLVIFCCIILLTGMSCSKGDDKHKIANNPSKVFDREYFYTIRIPESGEYIATTSRNIVLTETSEENGQQFQLYEREDGSYIVVCKFNGRALTKLGDSVRLEKNAAAVTQRWRIEALEGGGYAIKSLDGKFLSTDSEGNLIVGSQERAWAIELVESKPWVFDWSDEFNGKEVDFNNWHPEGGYIRNNELQYYTALPTNLFIKGGHLYIRTLKEEKIDARVGRMKYTSASINTRGSKSWLYGRFVLRAKLPSGEAIWPAFWMCGDNLDWPRDGEIDIFELWGGGSGDGKICSNVHWMDGEKYRKIYTDESFQLPPGEKFSDAFHIFMLEWDEEQLRFYLDGLLYAVKNIDSDGLKYAFNTQPHFVWVNTAVAPNKHGWGDASKNTYPQDYIIDYVRVYQQK